MNRHRERTPIYLSEFFISLVSLVVSQFLKIWDMAINKHFSWVTLVDTCVILLVMLFLLIILIRRALRLHNK